MNLDDLGDQTVLYLRSVAPATFARVLRDGQEFQPGTRPGDFRKMKDRGCFRNATIAVSNRPDRGFLYAEGFAQYEHQRWVHHAWVVDADGKAIEVTWRNPELRYVGVVLDTVELAKIRVEQSLWGSIFDV
jgi:hypothetical protein